MKNDKEKFIKAYEAAYLEVFKIESKHMLEFALTQNTDFKKMHADIDAIYDKHGLSAIRQGKIEK